MAHLTVTTFLALAAASAVPDAVALARVGDGPTSDYPHIELWITPREVFGRGDPVRVWFRSATEAYVTVFRIDTDGRIRVLFPAAPGDDNAARGGERIEVASFVVDDYPGTGYLFALASLDPLDYGAFESANHWDFQEVSRNERIRGDPYVALTDLVERIVPEDYAAWAYDLVPYLVDRRYDSPASWDPYRDWCGTFRQPVYGDPLVHLVAGLPTLDPHFWYPPIAAAPAPVTAGRSAPSAPATRVGRPGGTAPAGATGGGRGAAPPRLTGLLPNGSRSPFATPARGPSGKRGGSPPRPAARDGGARPEPRGASAPRTGAGRAAPPRAAAAGGPRPRR
ncbi:MAG: DUF4384 domain-containing protein [Gemmatimonadota bacterium]|nr:MAG: DUF4384 domain-containing protein [Gemmatimonadota bacterium]